MHPHVAPVASLSVDRAAATALPTLRVHGPPEARATRESSHGRPHAVQHRERRIRVYRRLTHAVTAARTDVHLAQTPTSPSKIGSARWQAAAEPPSFSAEFPVTMFIVHVLGPRNQSGNHSVACNIIGFFRAHTDLPHESFARLLLSPHADLLSFVHLFPLPRHVWFGYPLESRRFVARQLPRGPLVLGGHDGAAGADRVLRLRISSLCPPHVEFMLDDKDFSHDFEEFAAKNCAVFEDTEVRRQDRLRSAGFGPG
jgi:hypothetical protein